jgi:hypothetical protein
MRVGGAGREWALGVALAALVGCGGDAPPRSAQPEVAAETGAFDLLAQQEQARRAGRPLVLLIVERGQDQALAIFSAAWSATWSAASAQPAVVGRICELRISRNRAELARFHLMTTPLLVCLSPEGVVISRDAGPLDAGVLRQRIAAAIASGPGLDHQRDALAELAWPAYGSMFDVVEARRALADFLLGHGNDAEAVPVLVALAGDPRVPAPARVRAWVELARAHQWIGEPEKARHIAQSLITALGGQFPQALAGGELALGLLDAAGGRPAKARAEFAAAAAADPGSEYGRQAAALAAGGTP